MMFSPPSIPPRSPGRMPRAQTSTSSSCVVQSEDWNVSVVSVAPQESMPLVSLPAGNNHNNSSTSSSSSSSNSNDSTGAMVVSHQYWSARCVLQNEQRWIVQLWFTDPSLSLVDQKFDSRVLTLSHALHWSIDTSNNDSNAKSSGIPRVSLVSRPRHSLDRVLVYVVYRDRLLVWDLARSDLSKALAPPPHASLDLANALGLSSSNNNNNIGDTITALDVQWEDGAAAPMILVGTRTSKLYQLHQAPVPLSFRPERLDPETSGGVASSILSLFAGGSGGNASSSQQLWDQPIVALLSARQPASNSHFVYALTPTDLRIYQQQQAEAGGATTTTQLASIDLLEVLAAHVSAPPFQSLTCRAASIGSSNGSTAPLLDILVTTEHLSTTANAAVTTRVYWMQLNGGGAARGKLLKQAVWLGRFVQAPRDMQVVTTATLSSSSPSSPASHRSYATFREEALRNEPPSTCVMALEEDRLCELALPDTVARACLALSPDPVNRDSVQCWTEGGTRLRILHPILSTASTSSLGNASMSEVKLLQGHLLYAFAAYYKDSSTLTLPPSLPEAHPANLGPAVVHVATQLQASMDQHRVLLQFLQVSGLYAKLLAHQDNDACPAALFRIGQALAVRQQLESCGPQCKQLLPPRDATTTTSSPTDLLSTGWWKPTSTAVGVTSPLQACEWLVTMLETARTFEEETAQSVYQLYYSSNNSTSYNNGSSGNTMTTDCNSWTPRIGDLHQELLRLWDDWNTHATVRGCESLAPRLVAAGLHSLAARYTAAAGDAKQQDNDPTKANYVTGLHYGMRILIKVLPPQDHHAIAWQLSQQHGYGQGLCKLALLHERKSDAKQFDLVPLLDSIVAMAHQQSLTSSLDPPATTTMDAETGLRMDSYILQWHLEREYVGHVLKYGKKCPQALQPLLSHPSLRELRWVHDVDVGDHGQACANLANATNPESGVSAKKARFQLAMASLNNRIAALQSVGGGDSTAATQNRGRLIDAQLDCASIQEQCFPNQTLLAPEPLFERVLEQARSAEEFVQALSICMAMVDPKLREQQAARVWHSALMSDWEMWKDVLQEMDPKLYPGSGSPASLAPPHAQLVRLVALCRQVDDSHWKETVAWNPSMQRLAVQDLGNRREPMRRLWTSLIPQQ